MLLPDSNAGTHRSPVEARIHQLIQKLFQEETTAGRQVGGRKHRHKNAVNDILITDFDKMLIDPIGTLLGFWCQIYINLQCFQTVAFFFRIDAILDRTEFGPKIISGCL